MLWPIYPECTDEDELSGDDCQVMQGFYKAYRSHVVGFIEIFFVPAFCSSSAMDDDVPSVMSLAMHLE